MSPARRNFAVGATVLGGLIALGWMMLRFGSAPAEFFRHGIQLQVQLIGDRADGLAEGSQVLYRGVAVGRVTHLQRGEHEQNVVINALLDDTPPLPANVEGIIRTQSLISGQSVLSLELIGPPGTVPQGELTSDHPLTAKFVGLDLIPQAFGDLATTLEKTTHDIQETHLVAHLDDTIRQAGEVLKSAQEYVGDPKLHTSITESLENLRQTTANAKEASANFDKFSGNLQKLSDQASDTLTTVNQTFAKTQENLDHVSGQINDRLLQISKLLDSVGSIAAKIDAGQGTAGQLVNDPKLYQSLVDSSKELDATIADLRRLVEQWEQEGVSLKVK